VQLITLGAFALENTAMRRPRPLLLLTYVRLAGPVPRARLARLLWPHASDERNSLREALHALQAVDRNLIAETPTGLTSDVACDAAELLAAAETGDDQRVVALHTGPFLTTAPLVAVGTEFEEWALDTRERIARAARVAHLRLARHALDVGDALAALSEVRAALGDAPSCGPGDLETATLRALAAAFPACLRDRLAGLPDLGPQAPVPLPGVIGRAREAAAALEVLAEPGAWLQVVGLPGIGKSTLGRLVLHLMRAQQPHLEARSVLITAPQRSAHDLLVGIGAALGLDTSGSTTDLVARLATPPTAPDVLLLDLDAHVADLAGTLAPLRGAWSHTRSLVLTSRAHALPRATTVNLTGLDTHGPAPSDAARLLLAHVDLDDVEPHALATAERLARACAGHPLLLRALGHHVARDGWDAAEELAGRWLEDGTPTASQPPLDDRWRATVSDLPQHARDALARLAVADRVWWSRAAITECLDAEALTILGGTGVLLHGAHADLRLHPFVRAACRRHPPVTRSRWRDLSEEHARQQLAAAAADLVALGSDAQAAARRRMDERFDDLTGAVRRLPRLALDDVLLADAFTAIGRYADDRARYREGIAILTAAIDRSPKDGLARAAAVLARAWLEVRQGGHPGALATRIAAALQHAQDDPLRSTLACRLLGHAALRDADLAAAAARFREGLATAETAGLLPEQAALAGDLAAVAWLAGDAPAAAAAYRRCSDLAKCSGDRAQALACDLETARILHHTGHTEQAMRALLELDHAVALEDVARLRAPVHTSLSAAYRTHGDLELAYLHAAAAVGASRRSGNPLSVVAAATELAVVERARGQPAEAGRALSEAAEAAASIEHPDATAATLLQAADLLLAHGSAPGIARDWLRRVGRMTSDPALRQHARELLTGTTPGRPARRSHAARDLLGEVRTLAEILNAPVRAT